MNLFFCLKTQVLLSNECLHLAQNQFSELKNSIVLSPIWFCRKYAACYTWISVSLTLSSGGALTWHPLAFALFKLILRYVIFWILVLTGRRFMDQWQTRWLVTMAGEQSQHLRLQLFLYVVTFVFNTSSDVVDCSSLHDVIFLLSVTEFVSFYMTSLILGRFWRLIIWFRGSRL